MSKFTIDNENAETKDSARLIYKVEQFQSISLGELKQRVVDIDQQIAALQAQKSEVEADILLATSVVAELPEEKQDDKPSE